MALFDVIDALGERDEEGEDNRIGDDAGDGDFENGWGDEGKEPPEGKDEVGDEEQREGDLAQDAKGPARGGRGIDQIVFDAEDVDAASSGHGVGGVWVRL